MEKYYSQPSSIITLENKKGCLVILIRNFFVIILIPLLFLKILQYRHFYEVDNITFTFWKTKYGCYIMPYKYLGITIPKNNYMRAANTGGVIIYIGDESTLYIFPNHTYYLGADTIEINQPSYKYEYFQYINELKNIRASNDKMKYFKNLGYPFIDIYIHEMYAKIGNTTRANIKNDNRTSMNVLQRIIIGLIQCQRKNVPVIEFE